MRSPLAVRTLARALPALAVPLALALAAPLSAQPDPRRVVLIDPGDALLRAARAALEPWQVELVVLEAPSPGANAPAANERARALAERNGASAVVWVSEQADGYALWVYDSASGRVIERALNRAPPFDEATAAAVALSVKTLLRHSASAPEAERYGAARSSDASAVDPRPAPPRPDPPAPFATRDIEGDAHPRLSPFDQPRRPSELDLDGLFGFGLGVAGRSAELPRFGLHVAYFPGAGSLGVGLAVRGGPGARIEEPALHATLYDTTPLLAFELRARAARALRLLAAAGAGVHVIVLDGRLPLEASTARSTRVAPSTELELRADWLLASELFVGLRGQLSTLLATERYFARQARVLALSRFAFGFGLGFGISIP